MQIAKSDYQDKLRENTLRKISKEETKHFKEATG
jgi:hypothetical protein